MKVSFPPITDMLVSLVGRSCRSNMALPWAAAPLQRHGTSPHQFLEYHYTLRRYCCHGVLTCMEGYVAAPNTLVNGARFKATRWSGGARAKNFGLGSVRVCRLIISNVPKPATQPSRAAAMTNNDVL